MPLTNIFILVFILAMVYIGTIQGTFSAFLHLLVVIAAGTLAFAVWEPLTLSLLMKYLPLLAWTVGLLVPFGLLLIILRMTSDKLVPMNAKFPGIMNLLVGGGCGLLSGILTAGIAVIGIGLLPLGQNLGGWRPYTLGPAGVIQSGQAELWIPVHKYAAGFFSKLSGGAFSTGSPMYTHMPLMDVQAALLRERPDFVTINATPESVDVTNAYMVDAAVIKDSLDPEIAEALGSSINRPGAKIVIVDTLWKMAQGTVDSDRQLRIPSSHARLITQSDTADGQTGGLDDEPRRMGVKLEGPVGFSKPLGEQRTFYPYSSDAEMGYAYGQDTTFGFVYVLDGDQEPLFASMRKLRLNLPDPMETDPQKVLEALGTPPAPLPETDATADAGGRDTGDTTVGDRSGSRAGSRAMSAEISNKLPATASKNAINGLSIGESEEGAVIRSGSDGTATKPPTSIGQNNRINNFEINDKEVMVRLRIDYDSNQTVLGIGRSAAAALNPIFLLDSNGNQYFPTAWVHYRDDKSQEIHYDVFDTVRSAANLPLRRLGRDEEFYLYFNISRPQPGQPPIEIVSYNIGEVSDQTFDPPIRIE